MKLKDIMSTDPQCCTPSTTIQEAAQMMVDCDCGAIPVIEDQNGSKPIGIITDRDIACRAVAASLDPARTTVGQCMSTQLATVAADTSIQESCRIMEERQVRRLLAVDREGRILGIVAQADIALNLPARKTAEVVKEVSQPSEHAALAG
jgi:CBS domain-containing protein